MIKKWLDIIFDHRISLRERMFRLITGISMVALIFILILGRFTANILILAVSITYMYLVMKYSIRKGCINEGATAIVVLLLLLFPIVFFAGGGDLWRSSGVVCTLLHLYQHHIKGKEDACIFFAVYCRDNGVLLRSLSFS